MLLICYSTINPKWKKDGDVIKSNSPVPKSLLLSEVDESDSGFYSCSGHDGSTTFEAFSELLVGGM